MRPCPRRRFIPRWIGSGFWASTMRHTRAPPGVRSAGSLLGRIVVTLSGSKLDAKVIEVDTRRGETKLSIRAMKEDAEKAAYQEYREQVNREAKFGTFGDLFKK